MTFPSHSPCPASLHCSHPMGGCCPQLWGHHRSCLPEHASTLEDFSQGKLKRGDRKGRIPLLRSPHYFLNYNRNVVNATGPSDPCHVLYFPFLPLWPNAFWCSLALAWREDQGLCAEVSILVLSLKAELLAKWMFCSFPISMSPPSFSQRAEGMFLETCKHHAVGNGVNVNSIGCFISCPFV